MFPGYEELTSNITQSKSPSLHAFAIDLLWQPLPSEMKTESAFSSSSSELDDVIATDLIFGMALKKFRGIARTELEKKTLNDLDDESPFLNVNLALPHAVVSLLKEQSLLTDTNISVLKLSLSGIVNQLNKDQFNAVKPYLPKFGQCHVDDVLNTIKDHE
ncbi:hypothetical protein EC973_002195 [Apophysomyces ossiformis]|uniref:Uncharacterized protein n=1 Tax=Apophysomyces ossiformis TaxID=679940 RepID=A0A8H7BYD1_9FUNG|nr:hypothetical protein EC973_002195 [Apophysomyces ossiformis]